MQYAKISFPLLIMLTYHTSSQGMERPFLHQNAGGAGFSSRPENGHEEKSPSPRQSEQPLSAIVQEALNDDTALEPYLQAIKLRIENGVHDENVWSVVLEGKKNPVTCTRAGAIEAFLLKLGKQPPASAQKSKKEKMLLLQKAAEDEAKKKKTAHEEKLRKMASLKKAAQEIDYEASHKTPLPTRNAEAELRSAFKMKEASRLITPADHAFVADVGYIKDYIEQHKENINDVFKGGTKIESTMLLAAVKGALNSSRFEQYIPMITLLKQAGAHDPEIERYMDEKIQKSQGNEDIKKRTEIILGLLNKPKVRRNSSPTKNAHETSGAESSPSELNQAYRLQLAEASIEDLTGKLKEAQETKQNVQQSLEETQKQLSEKETKIAELDAEKLALEQTVSQEATRYSEVNKELDENGARLRATTTAYEQATGELSILRKKGQELEESLKGAEETQTRLINEKTQILTEFEKFKETAHREASDAHSRIALIEAEIQRKNEQLTQSTTEVTLNAQNRASLESRLNELQSALNVAREQAMNSEKAFVKLGEDSLREKAILAEELATGKMQSQLSVNELNQQIKVLSQNYETSQRQLSEFAAQNQRNETAHAVVRKQHEELQKRLVAAQKNKETTELEKERWESQHAEIQKQLLADKAAHVEVLRVLKQQHDTQLNEARTSISSLARELETSKALVSATQVEQQGGEAARRKLESQEATLQLQLSSAKKHKSRLETHSGELEKQLDLIKADLSKEKERRAAELTALREQSQNASAEAQANVDRLTSQLDTFRERLAEARAVHEGSEAERSQLNGEHKELAARHGQLETEKNGLLAERITLKAQQTELQARLESARKHKSETEAYASGLGTELDSIRAQLFQEKQLRASELVTLQEQSQSESTEAQATIEELTVELDSLREQLSSVQLNNTSSEATRTHLESENRILQAQHDELAAQQIAFQARQADLQARLESARKHKAETEARAVSLATELDTIKAQLFQEQEERAAERTALPEQSRSQSANLELQTALQEALEREEAATGQLHVEREKFARREKEIMRARGELQIIAQQSAAQLALIKNNHAEVSKAATEGINGLHSQLAEAQRIRARLEQEYTGMSSERDNFKAQLAEIGRKIEANERENRSLQEELEAARAQLGKVGTNQQDIIARNVSMESEIAQKEAALTALSSEHGALEQAKRELETNNRATASQLQELETKLLASNQQTDALTGKLSKKKEKIKSLKEESSNKDMLLQTVGEVKEGFKTQLEETQRKTAELENANREVQARLDAETAALTRVNATLTGEQEAQSHRAAELEKANREIQARLDAETAAHSTANAAVAAEKEAASLLAAELEKANREMQARLNAEAAALSTANATLASEKEAKSLLEATRDNLQKQLEITREIKSKLEKDLRELETAQKEIKRVASEEIGTVKSIIDQAKQNIEQNARALSNQLGEAEADRNRIAELLTKKEEETRTLETRHGTLLKEMAEIKRLSEESSSKLAIAEGRLQAVGMSENQVRERHTELLVNLEGTKKALAELAEEKAKLENLLEQAHQSTGTLATRIKELSNKHDSTKQQLTDELSELQTRQREKEEELNRKDVEVRKVKDLLGETQQGAVQKITVLEAEKIALQKNLTELDLQRRDAESQINSLRAQLSLTETEARRSASLELRISQIDAQRLAAESRVTNLQTQLNGEALRATRLDAALQAEAQRATQAEAARQVEAQRAIQLDTALVAETQRAAQAVAAHQTEAQRATQAEAARQAEAQRATQAEAARQVEAQRAIQLDTALVAETQRAAQAVAAHQTEAQRATQAEAARQAEAQRAAHAEAARQVEAQRATRLDASLLAEAQRAAQAIAAHQTEAQRATQAEAARRAEAQRAAQLAAQQVILQQNLAQVGTQRQNIEAQLRAVQAQLNTTNTNLVHTQNNVAQLQTLLTASQRREQTTLDQLGDEKLIKKQLASAKMQRNLLVTLGILGAAGFGGWKYYNQYLAKKSPRQK